jgi:hypothetical protein
VVTRFIGQHPSLIRFVLLSVVTSLAVALLDTPALGAPGGAVGDYNGDGIVSHADYSVLGDAFVTGDLSADGNTDGVVDNGDFAIYRANYGTTASHPSVLPFTVNSSLAPSGNIEWIFRFSAVGGALAGHLNIFTNGPEILSAQGGPFFLDDSQGAVGVPGVRAPALGGGIGEGISILSGGRAFAALGTTLSTTPPANPSTLEFLRLVTAGTGPTTLTYSGEYGYLGQDYVLHGIVEHLGSPGESPSNPLLPDATAPGEFIFNDVPSGQWFDPPLVPGFEYIMESASLFTSILDFPPGFDQPFRVVAEGTFLGMFGPGESVDFVALLGHGVDRFRVSGIAPAVDVEDPTAFPLQIAFNTPFASFRMVAIPEPTAMLLMLVGLAMNCGLTRWHR